MMSYRGIRESYEFLQIKCDVYFGRHRLVSGTDPRRFKNAIKERRFFGLEFDETVANGDKFTSHVCRGTNVS